MRLRSDFRTAVTIMNRLHRESGEECPEPIPFQQYQRWHPSSSSSSWWNWDKKLVELIIFKLLQYVRLQLMAICCNRRGCKQYTSHVTYFSFTARTCNDMSHRHWIKCLFASSHPCVMRLSDCLFSLRPSFCSLHCLSHLPLLLPEP